MITDLQFPKPLFQPPDSGKNFPESIAHTTDSFGCASESMTSANPSFTPANASLARASHLPCRQSTSPISSTNDSFKRVNEHKPLGSEMTCSVSDNRSHKGNTPRNSHKTSQLQLSSRKTPPEPTLYSRPRVFALWLHPSNYNQPCRVEISPGKFAVSSRNRDCLRLARVPSGFSAK